MIGCNAENLFPRDDRGKNVVKFFVKLFGADATTDGKAQACRPGELGKKKNEYEEAKLKEEREKSRLKNKEPKEEFVVGHGGPKNKTAGSGRNDGKLSAGSSESSLEDAFNGREQSAEENAGRRISEGEGVANEIHRSEEAASAKSKW